MRKGFTLVEVAVALGLLFIVLLYAASYMGGTSATSRNARLAAQAGEVEALLENALAKGLKSLTPSPNQTLTLDYGDPKLKELLPTRNATNLFKVTVKNLGTFAVNGVSLVQYRIAVCYKLGGSEVCKERTRLLPPPAEASATLSFDKPFEINVICPPGVNAVQVDLEDTKAGSRISLTQCGPQTVPGGKYQITPRPVTNNNGIRYEGIVTARADGVDVSYAPTTGAINLAFKYLDQRGPTSGGKVTINGTEYTQDALITLDPGIYRIEAKPFNWTDNQGRTYTYSPTAPSQVEVKAGEVLGVPVTYSPENGYVELVPLETGYSLADSNKFYLKKKAGSSEQKFIGTKQVISVNKGEQIEAVLEDDPKNPLGSAHPLKVGGFPHAASFLVRAKSEGVPTCDEVRSKGATNKVPQFTPNLGADHTVIYWCPKPFYGALNMSFQGTGTFSVDGPPYDDTRAPYSYSATNSSSSMTLYLPVLDQGGVHYTVSAYKQGTLYPQISNRTPLIKPNQKASTSVTWVGPTSGKKYVYFYPTQGIECSNDLPFPGDLIPITARYNDGSEEIFSGLGLHEVKSTATDLFVKKETTSFTGASGVTYSSTGPITCEPANSFLSGNQIPELPVTVGIKSLPYTIDLNVVTKGTAGEDALSRITLDLWINANQTYSNKPLRDLLSNAQKESGEGGYTSYRRTIQGQTNNRSPRLNLVFKNVDPLCSVSSTRATVYYPALNGEQVKLETNGASYDIAQGELKANFPHPFIANISLVVSCGN